MKRFFARLFGIAGAVFAVCTIWICLTKVNTAPVMLRKPTGAKEQAEAFMELVSSGDYSAAGDLMYGSPNLGKGPEEERKAEALIWKAFIDSISYRIPGECYASETGVTLDVCFSALDISSVTNPLKKRSEALLNQRVAQAEDVKEIYDENNDYREDFIQDILYDATQEALEQDARIREQTIPLHLVYSYGQWWVLPDSRLLDALSGLTSG